MKLELEVDHRSVAGDKYDVARVVADIVRPFVLDGSDELIPNNITLKEVARRLGKDPHKVADIIDTKQQLEDGSSVRSGVVFSDFDDNTWSINEGGNKHHARIKTAARMAGQRVEEEGEGAFNRTFKSMRYKFEFDS